MSGDPPARHAETQVVQAALRRAAGLGPFFAVDTTQVTGTPLADLYRRAGRFDLAEMVDHHARRLRTTERRVAASLLFQGLAARLWSPVLGCLPDGVVPDLDPARLHWRRGSPLELGIERPGGWVASDPGAQADLVARTVLDAHLRPLTTALRAVTSVAAGLLWGNAASALVGSALVADDERARALVAELLLRDPLRGTVTRLPGEHGSPLHVRRRSCCLFYRVPGGGLCGDCALHPRAPART